jgi:hypothetical protein
MACGGSNHNSPAKTSHAGDTGEIVALHSFKPDEFPLGK